MEAKGLKAADMNGKSDPYVVIKDVKGLNVPGKSVKTKIKDKTLEPVVCSLVIFLCSSILTVE